MHEDHKKVLVFDRETKKLIEERVWPKALLHFLYDRDTPLAILSRAFVGKLPFASWVYGVTQKTPYSRRKIKNFIAMNGIQEKDFLKNSFTSFSDFFVRKLHPKARPIANTDLVAPADGRYFCYNNFSKEREVIVKGETLSLLELLGNDIELSRRYENASMVVARLAPMDYHRFHTPVDGTPTSLRTIKGNLFSVNPIALRKSLKYITQNKRKIVKIQTKTIGDVLFIAVGATNVGSIHFTFEKDKPLKKGDEMGYFDLGGSLLICLFEKGRVTFFEDITEQSKNGVEVLCKMGQPLGTFKH